MVLLALSTGAASLDEATLCLGATIVAGRDAGRQRLDADVRAARVVHVHVLTLLAEGHAHRRGIVTNVAGERGGAVAAVPLGSALPLDDADLVAWPTLIGQVGLQLGGARRGGVAGRVDEPSQLTLIVECVDAIGDGDGGGVLGDGGQVDRLGAACEQGGGEAKAEKIDQRSHGHSLHCGPFDEGPGCCASALV